MNSSPPVRHLAMMITRRCNMSCGHCSVESGPHIVDEPDEAQLLDWLRQAAAAGVQSVQLTGGEPMLRERLVLRLLRECRRLGLFASMTTNGFWGQTYREARRRLIALRRAGLGALTVSYDRYHAKFQDHQSPLNISRAAEDIQFLINVSVVRLADDRELVQIVSPFEKFQSTRLRFYDVQQVGRARNIELDSLRDESEGFCNACSFPAITDDGRLTACNGPSYFAGQASPLNVGSLRNTPLRTLLERHREDPILDTIRTFGPSGLRDELKQMPEFETFPFRKNYHGLCDLCHHITSDRKAVEALTVRLSRSEFEAKRQAKFRVIEESRFGGSLSREYINGLGACKVFLPAISQGGNRLGPGAEKILGRADLDWRHLVRYLTECGLARPLLSCSTDEELLRWAPQFFIEQIKSRAIKDGLAEVVSRQALRHINLALEKIDGVGVILKGAALIHMNTVGGGNDSNLRAQGDIDIYITPELAPLLRSELLRQGFSGSIDAPRAAPHHLAPVFFQGIPIEIHTKIMPDFWGLPEKVMLSRARPLGVTRLCTLNAEGMMLHAGMHASSHLFTHGLKTAWDLQWLLINFTDLDWDWLTSLIESSRIPRGFWTPVRVLCHQLNIPLPNEFLCRAPRDKRQRELELIASHLLFDSCEGAYDLNPFSKNGLFLFLHDSWTGRARYLISLLGGPQAESRRSARNHAPSQSIKQTPRQFYQALSHWREFRKRT